MVKKIVIVDVLVLDVVVIIIIKQTYLSCFDHLYVVHDQSHTHINLLFSLSLPLSL